MTDEHLMRHWADAHSDFSGDLDRGMLRLGRFVSQRLEPRATNNTAYAHKVGRAALAGAMACLTTTFLMLSMALAATAGTHAASGVAMVDHIILA